MFRQTKSKASKVLAGLLALLILLSMMPVSVMFQVFAAEVETFTVKLPENVSATATLTDDNDAEKVFTVNTDENFEAIFEKLDDQTTYTLVVSGMELYKKYTKTGVVADAAAPLEILATDLTEKDEQTIAFEEESITKKYGNIPFVISLSESGSGTGEITYTSANEEVAKFDTTTPNKVILTGLGTVELKVSIAADEQYKAAEDTLTLTVELGENAIRYTKDEVDWQVDDVKTNDHLEFDGGASGHYEYSIDNTDVATIDKNTGEVTVLKPGTATVTAKLVASSSSLYKDSEATYTINAKKRSNALKYESTEILVQYGDTGINNTLLPDRVNKDAVTYTSNNPAVATVDENTGEYTIVGVGEAVITATLGEDDPLYEEGATATYTLKAEKKKDALVFDNEEVNKTYGDSFEINALKPGNITKPVTYTSSNTDVATVDEDTGEYTIVGAGTTTITATLAEGDPLYEPASASYTLNVKKKLIEFDINEKISFGMEDPDLTNIIKFKIYEFLYGTDNDPEYNEVSALIDEIASYVAYSYPPVNEDDNRPVGVYDITFNTDNNRYNFTTSGKLTVSNEFIINDTNETDYYEVQGLDGEWGQKVTIKVKDNRYQISKENKKSGWSNEITYDVSENVVDHKFYIKDNNETTATSDDKISEPITKRFGIDTTNPEVDNFIFKLKGEESIEKAIYFLSFGAFCNEEIDIIVEASDKATDDIPSSGIGSVTLYSDDYAIDTATIENGKLNGSTATFTVTLEQFATLKTVSAIATDNVGNESEKKVSFHENSKYKDSAIGDNWNGLLQLESTPAEITVNYPAPTSVDGEEKWYGDDVEFEVTVSDTGDENSGIRYVWATINGANVALSEFSVKPDEEPTDEFYWFINSERTEKVSEVSFKFNTSLADVSKAPDGKYRIVISAYDNAGNLVEEDVVIYIDREAPSISGFEFKATENLEGKNEPIATIETYGFFFTQDTDVVVTAKDNKPSDGVKYIEFYTIDKDGVKSEVETSAVTVDKKNSDDSDDIVVSATFKVKEGFKGQIFARAVDNVEHTTVNDNNEPQFFNPNGTAIENADRHKEHSEATVTLVNETTYTDNKGLPLYKWAADGSDETPDGIPVKLYVRDSFSGIKKIDWEVVAPYNATETDPKGSIEIDSNFESTIKVGDIYEGWTVEAVDKNLVTEMSKIIYVTNNSNAIEVKLSFNDRALNTSTANTLYFSIDNTVPTIDVVYDNNTSDEKYTDFYNANRIATVTVTERNFRASDVVFAITNTDKTIPAVDLTKDATWTLVENPDPDKTTHVATFEYAADGDYTFDISYKDNIENEAAAFAQHKFTIDKTLPTISVEFDNNTAANEKYFKQTRTATIVITEHNFDIERVDFSAMLASLNGAKLEKQPAPTWEHNGDVHTATIAFLDDADYTFDVKVTDKASNISNSADYGTSVAPKDFVVDKTIVKPTITGITNGGAYKNDVIPTVSFKDVNYKSYEIRLTRTRRDVHNDNVKDDFIKERDIAVTEQEMSGTFNTFEKIVENDGIYTLWVQCTDKAGNVEEQSYTFTVNRFGSVYKYNDKLCELIAEGGQYVKSVEDALVITEYNADKLLEGSLNILITRDGEAIEPIITTNPATITDGVEVGDSGWYEYVYTIDAATFAKDGVYKISLASNYKTDDSEKNESTSVPENSVNEKGEVIEDTMTFTVDSVAPEIRNIVNLDKKIADRNKISDEGKLNVKYTIVDVGGLKSIQIVLDDVTQTIEGDALAASAYNYSGEFDIAEDKNSHSVRIIVTDLAGNVTDTASDEFVKNHSNKKTSTYVFNGMVTVSRNFFVRWYANPVLFWGSIAGVIVVAAAVCVLVALKKKKVVETAKQ